jgi:agmatinase
MTANFLDLDSSYTRFENARYCVLPVPYDKTSTWLKGSDWGPEAIIDASAHLELYDIETDSEAYKNGVYTHEWSFKPAGQEEMVEKVYSAVHRFLQNDKLVITLGGEHSISIGAVKAVCDMFEEVTVLQLDAHADLRNEYQGSHYNHACTMARIREYLPIVQVGIRSMDIVEKHSIQKECIFYSKDIHDSIEWIDQVVRLLSQNVYITIDLDVFDPSVLPSTGTPEPGGLSWYSVLGLLKKVCQERNMIGFDVTELCPGEIKASDFLAAKLVYKLMSYHAAFSG